MFKDMGVEMVHLAEFHGDGHPQDPGPLRLKEMQAMFDECRRLSDDEAPAHARRGGQRLPRPARARPAPRPLALPLPQAGLLDDEASPGQPFGEQDPAYGTVYHVGDRADMLRLLEQEDGLAWTAHARIKASNWTPDIYRREDFYLSDHWLGAAWKAMPADLSHDRLGRRVLDLLDDMANWGQRKYVLGEVDVFKIDHTHELYGHMNINYLRLDRVPLFDQGWKPVLDALEVRPVLRDHRRGPDPRVHGRTAAAAEPISPSSRASTSTVRATLRWTFPLRFAELVSGDGEKVYRQRIDLDDTDAFGQKELQLDVELSGRKWVRLEAWDVACNGAFTQPVWLVRSHRIEPAGRWRVPRSGSCEPLRPLWCQGWPRRYNASWPGPGRDRRTELG